MGRYKPLLIVVWMSILISLSLQASSGGFDIQAFMNISMGIFLCLLSMFKLFDLSGFKKAFMMYDLVAKGVPPYAYVYPFLELCLGLSYLASFNPVIVNMATVFFMSVGLIGVIKALRAGLDVRCACLGTQLNVPLTTVTVVENSAMIAMAVLNLVSVFSDRELYEQSFPF